MQKGRKTTSALSKGITRYRPRAEVSIDENSSPGQYGRSVRSLTKAANVEVEQQAKRRRILEELPQRGAARGSAEDEADPRLDDDEWENVPFDFFGELAVDDAAAVPASQTGLAAGGTFVVSLLDSRTRIDTRTRAEQIREREASWEKVMPAVVDAYLAWKHASALAREQTQPDDAPDLPPPQGGDWFTVAAVTDTDFQRDKRIEQAAGELPVISLMRAGMMACTPVVPVVAISLGVLELYYRIRRRAPRLGILPFVRALCDKYMCHYRPYLREQFALAFDRYLAIQREVQRRLDAALGRNAPNWRAFNACAPCNYKLVDEEPLVIEGFLAMDGNQSIRRSASAGVADPRAFESDYLIDPAEVDLYAHEVRRRVVPKKTKKRAGEDEDDAPDASADAAPYITLEESGEPGDDAPKPSVCAHRWKNAKAEHHKLAPGMFDQTGVFVCLCRHGILMWFAEMIQSGELAKYPLALIARMIRAGFRCKKCGYDIGCAFQGTLERSELVGARAKEAGISCGLNSFHGYGHNRMCQIREHPLYKRGFGLEDLETCERFFSWLNGVGGVVRHASHFNWLQFIDLAMRQWDEDKYFEISKFLYNNVVQASQLVQELEPLVADFKASTGLTDEEIESWNEAELAYLEGLKAEPEVVTRKIEYIMLLAELELAEKALSTKQADYASGLREPSAEEIAAKRLSPKAAQKLYKARVDAFNKYMKVSDAVVALEGLLDIVERWSPTSREYQDAQTQMVERDWRKALDRLELLMVQRMFELAKSHTFGTGYKLRQAIGKGLKARSQAIRTAVARYNALADALQPPALKIDFAQLMEWTELQEFELLRHSRSGDIRERPWAQPANRIMAVKHYKLARAHEELARCRVETRRLVTSMRDEEAAYDRVCSSLLASDPALAFELGEQAGRRRAVNTLHRARLAKLALFAGFAECLTPGTRLGSQDATNAQDPNSHRATGADMLGGDGGLVQEELDAVDDGDEEEYERLHDFLANVE